MGGSGRAIANSDLNVSMAAGAHMLTPVAVMFHDAVVDMYLWWTSHLSRFHFHKESGHLSVC